MTEPGDEGALPPPEEVCLTLEEVQLLVVALEDLIDVLTRLMRHDPVKVFDIVGPLAGGEYQLGMLESRLGWTGDADAR